MNGRWSDQIYGIKQIIKEAILADVRIIKEILFDNLEKNIAYALYAFC